MPSHKMYVSGKFMMRLYRFFRSIPNSTLVIIVYTTMSQAEVLKKQGNEAFVSQEYKKAAKIYRDALKLDLNPTLLSNRAMCFIKLEDWDRAIRDCIEALKIQPPPEKKIQIKLLYRLGLAYHGKGIISSAIDALTETINLDLSNLAPRTKLAELQRELTLYPTIKVPLEVVDKIPDQYLSLLSPSHTSHPSERAKREIDALFPCSEPARITTTDVKTLHQQPLISETKTLPAPSHLSLLSMLPAEKKPNAYIFVFNIPPSDYQNIFDTTGVDSDFLNFFFDASAYIIKNNAIENCIPKLFKTLETFKQLPRYDLALMFGSKVHASALRDAISLVGNDDYIKELTKFI